MKKRKTPVSAAFNRAKAAIHAVDDSVWALDNMDAGLDDAREGLLGLIAVMVPSVTQPADQRLVDRLVGFIRCDGKPLATVKGNRLEPTASAAAIAASRRAREVITIAVELLREHACLSSKWTARYADLQEAAEDAFEAARLEVVDDRDQAELKKILAEHDRRRAG